MNKEFDWLDNYNTTKAKVGYVAFEQATPADYEKIGFKSGLEIHQQLDTKQKLFCRCPAGIYQKPDDYEAEVVRHMRPTLSELGEYDGTALMEFRTRKNITYRLKNETACTYDIDDTPPFYINMEALKIALKISLLSKQSIVGELHITRKQYLDGSIPTGFQRTGIVGIEGTFPISNKTIRLIQMSLEEDSCREVSDIGHERIYRTDRLGMPLIETVTYPDMTTPQEVAEAANYLRFLARSTGNVRTGIGASRQDVNVSCEGGTRVEIKGVAHIKWIPKLTHIEAFRQHALLKIKDELNKVIKEKKSWKTTVKDIDYLKIHTGISAIVQARENNQRLVAVNLPGFKGILSHFTQPNKTFSNEIADRLKVVACLEHPNMLTSEMPRPEFFFTNGEYIKKLLNAKEDDAQIIIWCDDYDYKTAVETIEERCLMAFEGVPNETRKALKDGTTIFERVLPGADRMYPDTDTAPIAIDEALIQELRQDLPPYVHDEIKLLRDWKVPDDCFVYIFKHNLMPIIKKIVKECKQNPALVGKAFGHTLKHIEGQTSPSADFSYNKVYGLFKFISERNLDPEIVKEMLPEVYEHPNIDFEAVLETVEYKGRNLEKLKSYIPAHCVKFDQINNSQNPRAKHDWIMGQLRPKALGNFPLSELSRIVEEEIKNV